MKNVSGSAVFFLAL